MTSNIVRFDSIRSSAIASITASYTPLGLPFGHQMRVLHFVNDSNGTYMISFDGINDNVVLLADGFTLYDLTSDQDLNEHFRYQAGTQIFIKSLVAPTAAAGQTDTVYLVAIYGKGE